MLFSSKGGGLYVTSSQFVSERPVANNTVLLLRGCYRCTVLDIYCASNSSYRPSIILPNGLNTGRDNYEIYNGRYTNYFGKLGIYTCRMTDSNGLPVDMSVGVYEYFR